MEYRDLKGHGRPARDDTTEEHGRDARAPLSWILREPLLHFAVIGALLFAAYGFLNREPESTPQEIVVTPGQIENLITTFSRTWQRPPTQAEMEGLIDQFVREEIFSREAVKLGLDRNDTVIRRRLQQKMEFLTEDLLAEEVPNDAELKDYLQQHPDAFREEPRFTFRQVFLSSDKRGDRLQADADQLLAQLRSKGAEVDPGDLGDPTLLPQEMTGETLRGVENTFGREFAEALSGGATGEWIGPVRSGFGLHLVRVDRQEKGRIPELAEVRNAVLREWENVRRIEANRQFYEELKKRYRISIEWPEQEGDTRTATR